MRNRDGRMCGVCAVCLHKEETVMLLRIRRELQKRTHAIIRRHWQDAGTLQQMNFKLFCTEV